MTTIGPSLTTDLTATEAGFGKGFSVGDLHVDGDGNFARYVLAASNVSQYMVVSIDGSGNATPLTSGTALAAQELGVAHYANIASASYGWVVVAGRPLVLTIASCNPSVPIFTTDTAGAVDDATGSASHFYIVGLKVHATNGSSGTGPTRGTLNMGATVVIPRATGHS